MVTIRGRRRGKKRRGEGEVLLSTVEYYNLKMMELTMVMIRRMRKRRGKKNKREGGGGAVGDAWVTPPMW